MMDCTLITLIQPWDQYGKSWCLTHPVIFSTSFYLNSTSTTLVVPHCIVRFHYVTDARRNQHSNKTTSMCTHDELCCVKASGMRKCDASNDIDIPSVSVAESKLKIYNIHWRKMLWASKTLFLFLHRHKTLLASKTLFLFLHSALEIY